jgi:hypothetical protein
MFGLFCCEQATCQVSVQAKSGPEFIKFDDPHCSYTLPTAINAFQVVTGSCSTKGGPMQGFVRDASGNFTIFNPPGSVSTEPMSINSQGFIAGNYFDGTLTHGFVRAPDGTFTTISFSTGFPWSTTVSAINEEGVVTGSACSGYAGGFAISAYVLPPGGTLTWLGLLGKGVVPFDINDGGVVTGTWFEYISDNPEGFVYKPDGTKTTFMPGIAATIPFGINHSGVVAGAWRDPVSTHGFLRASDGTVTSYTYPGNITPVVSLFCSRAAWTMLGGINVASTVTGTLPRQRRGAARLRAHAGRCHHHF